MNYKVFEINEKKSSWLPAEILKNEDVGIFETLRVYNGRIFRAEEHLIRLQESAQTAGFSGLLNLSHVKSRLCAAVKENRLKEASLRVTLLGDALWIVFGKPRNMRNFYKSGVSLRTSPVKRSLSNAAPPEIKTSCYQNAVMASIEPGSQDTFEWLFLDKSGYVTEVRVGNIFVIPKYRKTKFAAKQELITPPLQGILNGVTRRFVIECASRIGIKLAERPVTRHEIFNAGEVFLTNSSWEVLPVRQLDGRTVGGKIPGNITEKIRREFKKGVLRECRSV